MEKLTGIIVPMVTPMKCDGTLDIESLRNLVDYTIAGGVAGIFPLGTTGEGPCLSAAMQRQVICETIKAVNGRVPVLAGVSAASVYESIELGKFAKAQGAFGVVAAAPCYMPLDDASVVRFFELLAAQVNLPVYLYNMPSMTKIYFKSDLVIRLAQIPGVAGYKDSSGDMNAFQAVLAELKDRDDFSLFMGPEALMPQAVLFGGSGGVNSGSNLFPSVYVNCYKAAAAGDLPKARLYKAQIDAIQKLYNWGFNASFSVMAALKTGLKLKGVIATNTICEPAVQISPEIEELIASRMPEF